MSVSTHPKPWKIWYFDNLEIKSEEDASDFFQWVYQRGSLIGLIHSTLAQAIIF